MKKLFVTLFLIVGFTFAQDAQSNKSVELPQFIISGDTNYEFLPLEKIKPVPAPTLSKDYFLPQFTPEELQVKEIPQINYKVSTGLDSFFCWNGTLDFMMGFNNIPRTDFTLYSPVGNTILFTDIKAFNQRAYISNADAYGIDGLFKLKYVIPDVDNIFSNTNINFDAGIKQNNFKFYGSVNPVLKRSLTQGDILFGLKNYSSNNFLYELSFQDNPTKIPEDRFFENLMTAKGYVNIPFSNFEISGKVNYISQYLNNQIVNRKNFGYLSGTALIGLKYSNSLRINLGFEFSHLDTNFTFTPYGAIVLKLDDGLEFYGEYSQETEFLTNKYFLDQNKYFNSSAFTNFFFDKSGSFLTAIKYELKRFLEISGGFKYVSSNNYPYFEDKSLKGFFDINTTKAKNFSVFGNFQLHSGKIGFLYGEVSIGKLSDTLNNVLPFSPNIQATVTYNYNFDSGISAGTKFSYRSTSYADIANEIKINPYYNLSFFASFNMSTGFRFDVEFNNLLNKVNYIWYNYKELPLDVLFGINYRW
jgi:hypothetical protein